MQIYEILFTNQKALHPTSLKASGFYGCFNKNIVMATALELSKKYKSLLDKHKINTPLRLAHFFAQLNHESNLQPKRENLNYSTEGLLKTFKKYLTVSKEKENKKKNVKNPKEVNATKIKMVRNLREMVGNIVVEDYCNIRVKQSIKF